MDWNEFCTQFIARFGAIEEECLFNSFKQLKQTSTVDHYYGQFEKFSEQLKRRIPSLTEEFFLQSFTGGLLKEVRDEVRLLDPETVEQAFRKARFCADIQQENFKELNKYPNGKDYKRGDWSTLKELLTLETREVILQRSKL